MNKENVVVSLTVSEPFLKYDDVYAVKLHHPMLLGQLELAGSLVNLKTLLEVIDKEGVGATVLPLDSILASMMELATLTKAIKRGG